MSFRITEILIDAAALEAGVSRVARELDRGLSGKSSLLVGVLKGSIFFLADLARKLSAPVSFDFVQVSSYRGGMKSSGEVRLIRDLSTDIAGRDVFLVEDIVDTGQTLRKILQMIEPRGPASVKICTLLRKKMPDNEGIPLDYVGFEIEDRFVVGYGLDYEERYRDLPFIAVLGEGDKS